LLPRLLDVINNDKGETRQATARVLQTLVRLVFFFFLFCK
jgi:hypothetical protein